MSVRKTAKEREQTGAMSKRPRGKEKIKDGGRCWAQMAASELQLVSCCKVVEGRFSEIRQKIVTAGVIECCSSVCGVFLCAFCVCVFLDVSVHLGTVFCIHLVILKDTISNT